MYVTRIFLLFVGITCGYNVDTDFPIIFSRESASANNNNYFGYTVYLYHEPINGTSWLIVGAPKGNYSRYVKPKQTTQFEPGVVYRCTISSGNCEEIKPQVIENEEEYITQLGVKMIIRKEHGWFGSALSINELNGLLTVCAPRTIVTILNPFTDINLDTMQGMCYSGNVSSNALILEDRNLQFHDFKSPYWYNPLHGFSIHYSSTSRIKDTEEIVPSRIIGEPKHESFGTADIIYSNKRMTIELALNDELLQFGYSVQSGYFFKRNQLLFASSAPGWHYMGLVGIINPASKSFLATTLYGTSIGEFFGASLAVGDLNNDGLDDLIVGAPYWGEDNGKVYTYFGTPMGHFEKARTLHGCTQGGHFGYTLASGDLDADGFDDIIVGAPWEEDGVIYIYNGGSDLKSMDLQMSQRIEAKKLYEFNASPKLQRFGFSISKPVDIDGNGYLDIAVGAYKSEHAIIFCSKPIVKTELVIETIPNTLQRDDKQFLIKICPKYTGYNIKRVQEFKITITVDERYKRTNETVLELKSSNLTSDICLSGQVNILSNIRDFIIPITIIAKHDFVYDNASKVFCEFCPVENKNNRLQIAQITLPFNIGCGEDRICNSNISASAKFCNVRDNSTWVIGSNDVSLEIDLKNYGEPAYLTTLEFVLPEGVALRSILPSCQENASTQNLVVICDTGNPIWNGDEKNIKLDLDMQHLSNDLSNDHNLYFHVTVKTRSINLGTKNIISVLNLVSEVSLSLYGKANQAAYYLTAFNEKTANISFQHTYQVYKLGASPMQSARIIVKVPLSIKDSETLVQAYKPRLYMSNEYFECSSGNILLDSQPVEVQEELSLDQIDRAVFFTELEHNRSRAIDKRDVKESFLWPYGVESIKIPQTMNESLSDIIYINCSTPTVNCIAIVCDLNGLETFQDIGKIVIKLCLDINKLKDNFGDNRAVLKYSTEASVEIIEPAIRLSVNETRSRVEVLTMIYNTPKTEKLQLWIIMVSVLVGLLLLLVFTAVLSTLGFFKRNGKQDLAYAKSDRATEKGTAVMTKSENA